MNRINVDLVKRIKIIESESYFNDDELYVITCDKYHSRLNTLNVDLKYFYNTNIVKNDIKMEYREAFAFELQKRTLFGKKRKVVYYPSGYYIVGTNRRFDTSRLKLIYDSTRNFERNAFFDEVDGKFKTYNTLELHYSERDVVMTSHKDIEVAKKHAEHILDLMKAKTIPTTETILNLDELNNLIIE